MKKSEKINYKIAELPKWDFTLIEIFKVDRTFKVPKMTLKHENKLYRINIPKTGEWENIQEGDKVIVSVDLSPTTKYGKLYNETNPIAKRVKLR